MSANTTTWTRGTTTWTDTAASTTYTAHEGRKTATVTVAMVDGRSLTTFRVHDDKRTDYALEVAHGPAIEKVLAFVAGLLRTAARPVTTRHYR